jgi:hypothetical protein
MIERFSSSSHQVRRRPLIIHLRADNLPRIQDVVNLRDDGVARLERSWGKPFANKESLAGTETLLGCPPSYEALTKKSFGARSAEAILRFRDVLRRGWEGDAKPIETIGKLAQAAGQVVPGEKGTIEFEVEGYMGLVAIFFMRDAAAKRLGRCANPECDSPFFVRGRRTQRFCDSFECMAYSHRISANKYWDRRRAEKAKKAGGRKR